MKHEGLEKWEKHAKETYQEIINKQPTKENAILLASALTILGYEKLMDLQDRVMGSERTHDRMYDSRTRDRYDRMYDERY